MEYNYEDTSEVPDIQSFKEDLVEELLKSVFFQHKSDRKYNMLKLPIISAPSLIQKQVNNDAKKETLMEKEFTYKEETLAKFITLVDAGFKINRIQDLSLPEARDLSKQLGVYSDKKSGEMMKIDLINLSKIFLAGQVCSVDPQAVICFKNKIILRELATPTSMRGEGQGDGRTCIAHTCLRYCLFLYIVLFPSIFGCLYF